MNLEKMRILLVKFLPVAPAVIFNSSLKTVGSII